MVKTTFCTYLNFNKFKNNSFLKMNNTERKEIYVRITCNA